jgi:hypothetical protein
MKTPLIPAAAIAAWFAGPAGLALAQEAALETKERVLRDGTTPSVVLLTAETVRCSALGYGRPELKVSVPDLKHLAVLDHANEGEAAPCVTAGACRAGNDPESILDPASTEATTELRVTLVERYVLDHVRKTCHRTLSERVQASIRGKEFRHLKGADLGALPYEACVIL